MKACLRHRACAMPLSRSGGQEVTRGGGVDKGKRGGRQPFIAASDEWWERAPAGGCHGGNERIKGTIVEAADDH